MANSISETNTFTILATSNSANNNKNKDKDTNTCKESTSKSKNKNNDSINNNTTISSNYKEMELRSSLTTLQFDGYLAIYDMFPLYVTSDDNDDYDYEYESQILNKNQQKEKLLKTQAIRNTIQSIEPQMPLYLCPHMKNNMIKNRGTNSTDNDNNENTNNDNNNDELTDSDSLSMFNDIDITTPTSTASTTTTTTDITTANNGVLQLSSVLGIPHKTSPPNRFTESSFVKELEDVGVGMCISYDKYYALYYTISSYAIFLLYYLYFLLII